MSLFVKNTLKNLFYADLRSLAALRVGVALLILIDLMIRLPHLAIFNTDFGIIPRNVIISSMDRFSWSIHLINGTFEFQFFLFIVAAIFAIMLLVGYKTKLATIISWILLLSLQTRTPMISDGGDVLFRMLLFWGMFLPWQARYSVDSLKNEALQKLPNRVFSVGILGYFLQVCFVYIFTYFFKTGAEWRTEYSAVYYALSLDQFATPLGTYMLNFPIILTALSFFTIWFELLGPYLLFFPIFTQRVRLFIIFLFICMHIGFAAHMYIGLFPLIDIIALLGFLPPLFWDSANTILRKIKATKLTIYYDMDCGLCTKSVSYIKMFFLLPYAHILPAASDPKIKMLMEQHQSWIIKDSHGKKYFKSRGIIPIIKASPLLFPFQILFYIPGFFTIGDKIYEFVSIHRNSVCPIRSIQTIHEYKLYYFSPITNLIAAFFLIYIFAWNISTLPNQHFVFPSNLRWITSITRIDQMWNMFSPFPLKEDGWYVVPGTLTNGKTYDFFNFKQKVTYGRPSFIAGTYDNFRIRKFFMNLYTGKQTVYQQLYLSYVCNSWNTTHSGEERLNNLQLIFMMETTPPPGEIPKPAEKRILYEFTCRD